MSYRYMIRYTMKQSEEFDSQSIGFYQKIIKWLKPQKSAWGYEKGKAGNPHVHIYVENSCKKMTKKNQGNWFNRKGYKGSQWYMDEAKKSPLNCLAYTIKDGNFGVINFTDNEVLLAKTENTRQRQEYKATKLLSSKGSMYSKYLEICQNHLKSSSKISHQDIFNVIYETTINSDKAMLSLTRMCEVIHSIYHKLNTKHPEVKKAFYASCYHRMSKWHMSEDLCERGERGIRFSKVIMFDD